MIDYHAFQTYYHATAGEQNLPDRFERAQRPILPPCSSERTSQSPGEVVDDSSTREKPTGP
jgi:hypothetical protein